MSKMFAGIMALIAVAMLALQFGVAEEPKLAVGALWGLVLLLCVYVLFLRKAPAKRDG